MDVTSFLEVSLKTEDEIGRESRCLLPDSLHVQMKEEPGDENGDMCMEESTEASSKDESVHARFFDLRQVTGQRFILNVKEESEQLMALPPHNPKEQWNVASRGRRDGGSWKGRGVLVLRDVPVDLSMRQGEEPTPEPEDVEGQRAGTQKKHRCVQCGKAFATPSHLRTHARTHSGSKPFRCPDCTAAFAQSNNLRRHLRTHTRERPYKCTHCDCAFRDSSHLQRHRLLHTGERPFRCSACGAAFAQSNTLRDHLRLHTGERPFACSACPEAFVRRSHLSAHRQRAHGSGCKKDTVG